MAYFWFLVVTLVLAVAQSNGLLTSEVYWHSMLPNTPMPMSIRQRLSLGDVVRQLPEDRHVEKKNQVGTIDLVTNVPSPKPSMGISSNHLASNNLQVDTPNVPFYFLERDLHVGLKLEVMFKRPLDGDHFLTPKAADSIPFSSTKLPDILNLLSIHPYSLKAKKMEQVHHFCELPPLLGERKHCATSLESMVDFITSSLNGSAPNMIKAISSATEQDQMASPQSHTVVSISRLPTGGTTSIVCHLEAYPYTVYRCHTTATTQPYVIKLATQPEGSMAEAAATCHRDTSQWDARHYALQALKVKPGGASVCHFLPLGDVVFFPTETFGSVESTVFIC